MNTRNFEVTINIAGAKNFVKTVSVEYIEDFSKSLNEAVSFVANYWLDNVLTEEDNIGMADLLDANVRALDSDNVELYQTTLNLDYQIKVSDTP